MIKIRQHIPNAITSLNLFSGCLACVMAFEGNYIMAAVFIYASAIFDFFDGFAARLLKAYSAIGKDLDSLADCVSFGVAPGIIMFSLFKTVSYPYMPDLFVDYIPYVAFIIPVFSALRLAKFNVDERQTTSFIGLPTPANAIFIASLASSLPCFFLSYGYFLIIIVLLFSYLLVAEIPMFSLKFKNLKLKDNLLRFIFLTLAVAILVVWRFENIYLIIVLYILIAAIAALACHKNK